MSEQLFAISNAAFARFRSFYFEKNYVFYSIDQPHRQKRGLVSLRKSVCLILNKSAVCGQDVTVLVVYRSHLSLRATEFTLTGSTGTINYCQHVFSFCTCQEKCRPPRESSFFLFLF